MHSIPSICVMTRPSPVGSRAYLGFFWLIPLGGHQSHPSHGRYWFFLSLPLSFFSLYFCVSHGRLLRDGRTMCSGFEDVLRGEV